jgi:hypothetical protein
MKKVVKLFVAVAVATSLSTLIAMVIKENYCIPDKKDTVTPVETEESGNTGSERIQKSLFAVDSKPENSEIAEDGCETVSGENP